MVNTPAKSRPRTAKCRRIMKRALPVQIRDALNTVLAHPSGQAKLRLYPFCRVRARRTRPKAAPEPWLTLATHSRVARYHFGAGVRVWREVAGVWPLRTAQRRRSRKVPLVADLICEMRPATIDVTRGASTRGERLS